MPSVVSFIANSRNLAEFIHQNQALWERETTQRLHMEVTPEKLVIEGAPGLTLNIEAKGGVTAHIPISSLLRTHRILRMIEEQPVTVNLDVEHHQIGLKFMI